jgi:hypothetical protein
VLQAKYFWGALVIVAMWLAVLIVGVVSEAEFVVDSPAGQVNIPAVWGLALMALIGSWVVAAFAFRDGVAPEPKKEEKPLPPAEG